MAGRLRRPACAAWLVLVTGCVYESADPELEEAVVLSQGSLVIPLGSGDLTEDDRVLLAFYEDVLRQMQGAYVDRDLRTLRGLLDGYDTPKAPRWVREHMESFEALAEGLAFELHCRDNAGLQAPEELPAIGEPLVLRLELPPAPGRRFVLGGEGGGDPFAFGLLFVVEDRDAVGGVLTQESNDLFRLPRDVELVPGEPLVVPVELAIDAGTAVARKISVWLELLPGFVRSGELRAPVRRQRIDRVEVTLYPANVERVRERPLLTLREAMRRGDAEHFAHVFLAARFLREADRDDDRQRGTELLMQWVRIGRADQARAAMAALRELTGADIPVGDRDAWLLWWQRRDGGTPR